MIAAFRPAHFVVERVHKFAVICQSRQGVVLRLVTDLLLALLALRDVDPSADATLDFTGRRAQRAEMDAKMTIAEPILKICRNTSHRFGVPRHRPGLRI